ncbi:hypothetical protein ACFCYB_01910 [Streptomyces sp. NPDC056309]|uniref:hypothetical protein n=1 Tax=unclassified Streptomyces TaxID=2593676 RepID=UPI0035D8EE40
MSDEVREGLRPETGAQGGQHNAAHEGGTQYITGGGDVRNVSVFLTGVPSASNGSGAPANGRKAPSRARVVTLVGTGMVVATALAAAAILIVQTIHSPRTGEAASSRDALTDAKGSPSATPSPSPSSSPSLSSSGTPSAVGPPPAWEATTPSAAPTLDTTPSKNEQLTTASRDYPATGLTCGHWRITNSADVKMRACVQAVENTGRASFGAEVVNNGEEAVVMSVLVAYVSTQEDLDCRPKSDPWTPIVINPGDTWRSALSGCIVDGLRGHAVQARAWAAMGGNVDPQGSAEYVNSFTVQIKADGTVEP